MTAIDDFIANLRGNRYSAESGPMVGDIDLFVLALQQMASALPGVQTYTPALVNVTNLDASAAFVTRFVQVNNWVIVWGKVDVDPTAAAATELGIALPVASAFTLDAQLAGVGSTPITIDRSTAFSADVANARAQMRWVAQSTVNHTYFFLLIYQVL